MRKFACFAFSFAAAALVYFSILPRAAFLWIGGVLIAGAVVCGFCRMRRRLAWILVLSGLAAGFLWSGVYDGAVQKKTADAEALSGGESVCILRDYSEIKDYGMRLDGDILTPEGKHVRAELYVFTEEPESLRPGTVLQGSFALENSRYAFGSRTAAYVSRGVYLTGICSGEYTVQQEGPAFSLRYLPRYLARVFSAAVDRLYTGETASFMRALLLGDQSGIRGDDGLSRALSVSGTSHIVAVSGMHVSFLVSMVMLLIRDRKKAAPVAFAVMLLFAGITGFPPSIMRAVIMQSFVLLAFYIQRETDTLTFLAAALFFLIAQNPYSILNAGLQMSFAATLGILLFSPRLQAAMNRLKIVQRAGRSRMGGRAVRFLTGTAASSAGAAVLTTPVTAWYFGRVSLVSLPVNLLVLWAVAVVFCFGFLSLVLALLWLPLGRAAAFLPGVLTEYILSVINGAGSMRFAALYTENPYFVIWLLFVYIALAAFIAMRGRLRNLLLPGCAAAVLLCAAVMAPSLLQGRAGLTVTVLDVGQGQCVILRQGELTAVCDCGGSLSENAGDIAADYLTAQGCGRVDLLILTHYDSDHCNGVIRLMDRMDVTVLLPDGGEETDTDLHEQILRRSEEEDVQVLPLEEDRMVEFGEARLCLLTGAAAGNASENDNGVLVLASEGEFDVLIPGDASAGVERNLLERYDLPDLEVLVAGHHGSNSSTSALLLEKLKPETVLISVGENSYGHPGEEMIARVEASGAEYFRTDLCGTLTVSAGQ